MKVKCPICNKESEWEGNPFRPFCSEKCSLIDLGKWADEKYSVEGEKAKEDEGEEKE